MEGAKTKYILVALVVIVIVVASIGYYLIKDAGVEGITAMEGKIIGDNLAKTWHDDAILVQVGSMDSEHNSGFSEAWIYTYNSPSTEHMDGNFSLFEMVQIIVYANQTTHISYWPNGGEMIPITNWTIDSTHAYEIALDNQDISDFLHKYPSADPGSSLWVRMDYPDCPSWHICWQDWGFIDDPHNAEIYIDANTGEVLYVRS